MALRAASSNPAAPSPPISRLAPLGVPTTADATGADLPAAFRIWAQLPGSLGPEIRLDAVSLGPGGLPLSAAGAHPELPAPALTGDSGLLLRRLAEDRWEAGFQAYVSEPLVLVADLRASSSYVRTAAESTDCERCDGAAAGVQAGSRQLLSGHALAIRLPAPLRASLAAPDQVPDQVP